MNICCSEYLAIFKKTVAMHEVFLCRVAAHPVLRKDLNFHVFLEYNQDVSVTFFLNICDIIVLKCLENCFKKLLQLIYIFKLLLLLLLFTTVVKPFFFKFNKKLYINHLIMIYLLIHLIKKIKCYLISFIFLLKIDAYKPKDQIIYNKCTSANQLQLKFCKQNKNFIEMQVSFSVGKIYFC